MIGNEYSTSTPAAQPSAPPDVAAVFDAIHDIEDLVCDLAGATAAAEAMATTGQDAASGLLESITGLFGAQPEEGVRVAESGLEADNGVVHAIDHVLVPEAVVEELAR